MHALALSLLLTCASSLILGFFVLSKKPSSPINVTWFATSLAVSAWSLFIVLMFTSHNADKALFFGQLCNISSSFIPVFLLHFCLSVTHTSLNRQLILKIGYFNSFLIALLGFTQIFLSVRPIFFFNFYPEPGPLYHYFTLHFFILAAYSEYILFKNLNQKNSEVKNQLKYIITATSFGFISGGSYFLPVYNLPMPPIIPHFVWLYAAIISYAIIKHRLMDIKIVLRTGLIYSFLIGLITSFYIVVVYIAGQFFQSFIGVKSWGMVLLIFTSIALIFKPLERKIQVFVDRLIFKKSPQALIRENEMLLGELQKSDQMKAVATLAAGMAHEIKNPLTSIKTFAEYLPLKYDDPGFREKFSRIVVDEVDRVNNIVKQLLEFSKPKDLELKPESITGILDDTLGLLNNNLIQNKIEVVKNYKDYPVISVDKNQLKQAFLNLFLNSIQAMPNGGILTVSVSLTSDFCVLTSISDTGVGIPKDQLDHIFDPFFTTKESGTGLGLSIVHGIITKHGGKISVESENLKGVTISLILKNQN